jgi:CBS domain-containing protein
MLCPACEHDNVAGADLCESCGLDLAGLDVRAWAVDPEEPQLALRLGQLPLRPPITLPPGATVAEAVVAMRQRHEGCVFVLDEADALAGVFTERDLVARVVAKGRDPAETRLEDVMTPRPVALRAEDPLAWALHRMGVDGYRHLPVVDGTRLVGFLSARTVLEALLRA